MAQVDAAKHEEVSSATMGAAARSAQATVVLSPFAFRLCWWLVMIYHVASASFVAICGVAHLLMSTASLYQSTWMLAIPQTTLLIAGWCYVGVAALHVAALVTIVGESIADRKLKFSVQPSQIEPERSSVAVPKTQRWWNVQFVEPARRRWDRFFGVSGYLGPQGRYFEFVFHVQLYIDIASQTYQAYVISWSLPARAINRIAVGTLVVYCVNTPVIDRLLRHKPALRRLTNLVVDLVLDFVSAVLPPLWVLAPSLRQFDWSAGRFPQELTYDDKWVAVTMAQGRQVLVNSWIDGVTSVLPHLLSFLAIRTVKDILRCSSACVADGSVIVLSTVGLADASRFTKVGSTRRALRQILLSRRTIAAMNVIAVAWAVVDASLHLLAESQANISNSSCELRVLPWVSARFPCTVANLNCYRLGTEGRDDKLAVVLDQFDRSSLTKLIFSHCSSLQVPSIMTEFRHLRSLEVFNSTISRWGRDAALTRTTTPHVVQVQLVATNVSGAGVLPDGILHDQLPRDLNLVMHRSNLSELPTDIDQSWGRDVRWITLWIEYTKLKALPLAFASLTVAKLSLVGNQLTNLPEDVFTRNSRQLSMIRVSDNPLAELPRSAGDLSSVKLFVAENTSVTIVPTWLSSWRESRSHENPAIIVSLYGSPVCLQTSASMETDAMCNDVSSRVSEDFRFDLIAGQRLLD